MPSAWFQWFAPLFDLTWQDRNSLALRLHYLARQNLWRMSEPSKLNTLHLVLGLILSCLISCLISITSPQPKVVYSFMIVSCWTRCDPGKLEVLQSASECREQGAPLRVTASLCLIRVKFSRKRFHAPSQKLIARVQPNLLHFGSYIGFMDPYISFTSDMLWLWFARIGWSYAPMRGKWSMVWLLFRQYGQGVDGSGVARGASWCHDAPCVYFYIEK